MRATFPPPDLARIARQIELAPGTAAVRALNAGSAAATPGLVAAVLEGADRFARAELSPLNDAMDATGCTLADGRVTTASRHKAAWDAYVEAGWPTLEAPEAVGGQGLPAIVAFAAQELFDRACPAFGMLPVPQRSAFRLIDAFGDDVQQRDWLAPLARGECGATICVSEVEAGSDLPRVRTRARRNGADAWTITGEKCWISYGDHDLTRMIGHVVLAKADDDARPSLFLVPSLLPDGARNAVVTRRIEHKLGLHGSPTCALGFESAAATLLGERGRGLQHMFVMIANMRLAVGAMGLGIASATADLALGYAHERHQGGRPEPVPIADHDDVQRQLVAMTARADLLRGLLFALANASDLAAADDEDAAGLAQWLLPIVKTTGGETAFANASDAIQVLGGAGYTREWPAEQALRDARVLTVFEGTTGMQAIDLVHRRLLGTSDGAAAFLRAARALGEPRLDAALARFEEAAAWLGGHPEDVDAAATVFLDFASLVALGWIAAGYTALAEADHVSLHLRAIGEHWLGGIEAHAAWLCSHVTRGRGVVGAFAAIRRTA